MEKGLSTKTMEMLCTKIQSFSNESSINERKLFLTEEELVKINGICEPLYITNLGDAILIHYMAGELWTKAVFIPKTNLEIEEYLTDAIEWFFK